MCQRTKSRGTLQICRVMIQMMAEAAAVAMPSAARAVEIASVAVWAIVFLQNALVGHATLMVRSPR